MHASTTRHRHVFVCTATRPQGCKPACGQAGLDLFLVLQLAIERAGLDQEIALVPSGCVGCCEEPGAVLDPARGVVLAAVRVEDVPEVVRRLGRIEEGECASKT